MTLRDAAKKIPVHLVKSSLLLYAPPYVRAQIIEMQRRENESEKERRLAESLGITVRELRILQNPLFTRHSADKLGLDIEAET